MLTKRKLVIVVVDAAAVVDCSIIINVPEFRMTAVRLHQYAANQLL